MAADASAVDADVDSDEFVVAPVLQVLVMVESRPAPVLATDKDVSDIRLVG
jgi:hypothetical protein